MKILTTAAILVDWALAVVLSIAAVFFVFAHFFKETLGERLPETPFLLHGWGLVILALSAAAVLVLNVLAAWNVIRGLLGWEYLELESDGGHVSVSVRAVREALERALTSVEQVSGARVALSPPGRPGKPVIVRAYVDLDETVIYQNVSRGLVNILKARFRDIAGAGIPLECHVYWIKIRNDNPRLAGSGRRLPVDDLRPQFPVDQEEHGTP